jgi:uncharacterized membrane protein
MQWLFYAFMSAGASALTAILAKLGVEGVPSTLATAIRTVVVLVVAWAMVFAVHEQRAIPALSNRSLVFLVLSGMATGAAWFAYFRALQLGLLTPSLSFGDRNRIGPEARSPVSMLCNEVHPLSCSGRRRCQMVNH